MSNKITSVASKHDIIYFTLSSFTGNYHLPDVRKMIRNLLANGWVEDVAGVVVLFTGAVLDLLDVAVALVFCVEANGDGAVSKKLMSWALPAKTASSFRCLLVTIL